jgi:uncharacterized paraquat-inducible protein A
MGPLEIVVWIVFIIFVVLIMEPWKLYTWITKHNTMTDTIETLTAETLESINFSVMNTKQHTVDEVEVNCSKCGAPNKKLDTFCGYCGSPLYIEKTAKIRPVEVKPIIVGD